MAKSTIDKSSEQEESFVGRYACINDAIKAVPKATHLYEVCMGKRPNAGGFLWKYEDDYDGE